MMWNFSVLIFLVFIDLEPCSGFCPQDLVAATCYKSGAIVNIRFGPLVSPESPWIEFSGMNLFSSTSEFNASTFVPLEPNFDQQLLTQNLKYDDFDYQEANKMTILHKNYMMEMVWPVQESGDTYQWPVRIQCGFKNTWEETSQSLSFNGGAASGTAVTLQFGSNATETVPSYNVGERIRMEFHIPSFIDSVPETCAVSPGDGNVNFGELFPENACFLVRNRTQFTGSCTPDGTNSVTWNVTSDVSISEDNSKTIVLEWDSFVFPGGSSLVTVGCEMRRCNSTDRCSLNGFGETGQPRTEYSDTIVSAVRREDTDATWVYYIAKKYITRSPTPATTTTTSTTTATSTTTTTSSTTTSSDTTPSTTTATSTTATTSTTTTSSDTTPSGTPVPGRPTRNASDICLAPAEMWSIVAVPFGLILIALALLFYLQVKRNANTKKKALDSAPRVSVTTEPVLFRRPHLGKPQNPGRQRRDF